eukprot:CAMPEP_0172301562 /NCGR_PEP_ID=MMETSP1058-20130122/3413_1 /TAXON_ID=83371 /ORGANISM="Detonula confervacea, Strain CCMP 353" /LENGTH=1518 /DNA_ID=CAMNT_0013011717 /DNA_START=111 /DNA_END=4667 /DNA_ORIENTATION=+
MFGGLSIKGDSKDESSVPAPAAPNSGFSFLQSSIGAPAPISSANNAAAAPSSEPPAASAAGSAFGFMSSGGGQEEVAAPDPPTAARPSMFAGLSTSSSTGPKAPEPAAPPNSGFSFLSCAAPAPAAATPLASTESTNNADAASTTSTAGSSFSFMAGMTGSAVGSSAVSSDNGEQMKEINGEGLAVVQEKEGGMSGFSFLGAADPPPLEMSSPTMEQPPSLMSETTLQPTAAAPTLAISASPAPVDLMSTSNATLPTGSGVSWSAPPMGMMGTPGVTSKKVVKKKRGKRVGVGSSAAAPAQPTSIPEPSSIPEPAQSTGSFRPPPTTQSTPHPPSHNHGTMPQTPRAPSWGNNSNNNTNDNSMPPTLHQIPSTPTPPRPQLPESPPMRIKAERAMDKADEFIREKQRKSAIALAAERAMHDKSSGVPSMDGSASGPGWKMSNGNQSNAVSLSPASPKDETYQAAKAAAEEARKLAPAKGKTSLFSNFFHRGKGGSNSSAAGAGGHGDGGISTYSSHGGVISPTSAVNMNKSSFQRGNSTGSAGSGSGIYHTGGHSPLPPTRETLEVSMYGSPRSLNDEPPGSDGAMDVSGGGEEDGQRKIAEQQRMEHERQQHAEQLRREEETAAAEHERRNEQAKLERERLERERLEAEKRKAPREKLQSILDTLADTARTSTTNLDHLRSQRSELVERKSKAEKAERYAAQQLKFAETQQTVAAEEEDFESADRLGSVIEQHSKEKEEQYRICQGVNAYIAKLDKEKEIESKAVASCFASVRNQLTELQNEVDNQQVETSVLTQFATTSKRLSSESERLSNDLKHIERDEQVLEEEEKELSGTIGEETKEFDEQHKEASTKLEEVNETIEDLRKQLAVAEATASSLHKEIATHINSIQTVKSKYSRQLLRLEKKSNTVKESRADWTSEKESIEKAKGAHESVVAEHSEEMLEREALINDIKVECATAKKMEEIIVFHSAFRDESGDADGDTTDGQEGAPDDSSSALDGEVLKYEAVVNEATQNVTAAESNISNLREELSGIQLRVPILEDLKKAAASKRDFKAAGKASKEIKDALARREQCEAELDGEAMERKQFAEEELEKVRVLLEENKKLAAERGRETGLKQMEKLQGKIRELKSILKKFASSTTSDQEEEDAINVSCVGAFVIESQICVLEAEGRALGEKYGGWEETPSDNDIVEDASVQSAPTFDSAENENNSPEIVIDKGVLERYISLRNEMKELEGAIEEAAKKEDFDEAAELEERIQIWREEFVDAGFSSEKFEKALNDFMGKASSSATADGEDDAENSTDSLEKVIDESVLEKYSSLCAEIKDLESDIDEAVADEDYDVAAELEEKIQVARSDIESLGFSIDALEDALKDSCSNDAPPSVDEENNDAVQTDEQEEPDAVSGSDNKEESTSSEMNDEREATVEKLEEVGEDAASEDGSDNEVESTSSDEREPQVEKDEEGDEDADSEDGSGNKEVSTSSEMNDEKKSPDDNVKMNGEAADEEGGGGAVDNTDDVAGDG